MATNIGPKIGIEGEAEYRQKIAEIVQTQKTLKAELTATAAAFSDDASAQEKSAEKAKILQKQLDASNAKLKEQEAMLKEAEKRYGETDKRTQAWKETVAKTKTEIEKINREMRENSSVVAFGKDMEAAGRKMQEAGSKMSSFGRTMTRTVTLPIVAAGAAAIKLATDFETSIAKLSTIADTAEKPINQLKKEIMDLSDETGISASELSEQAYQAISAGRSTANAVKFVGSATKLARSGFAETGQTVDVLTTIMNAYGESESEVGKISDVLITTQNLGKATVAQLAETMGKAIPVAASYGVDLDNVAATYVTLTKQGISADVATTQLTNIMNQLGKSGTTASKVLQKKTGKSFRDLMAEGYSLSDVLKIVQEAAEEDGVALNDMFGNVRAAAGAVAIMNDGGETFNKTMKSMESAIGSTDKAFEKVSNTTAYQYNIALNRVKNSGIEAGKQLLVVLAPTIEKLTNLVERGAKAFGSMTQSEQQALIKTVGFAAAIGPALRVVGGLTTGVGKLTTAAGKLTQMWGMTGTVGVSGLLGAAGAALTLNAALAVLFTSVVENNNEILASAKATQTAAEKAGEMREEVESSAKAYKESASEMEQNEKRADALADKIEELSEKTNRTASENRELETAVETLNSIYPSLNLQIDKQTGALNKSNAEIRENIKALREQARAQAAQERAVEINRQIIDTEIQLEELHARTAQAAQDVADANKAMAEESEKYGTVSARTKITVDEATAAEAALSAEITAQEETLQTLQNQLSVTETYLTDHESALQTTTEAQTAATGAIEETEEALAAEAEAAAETAQKMYEAAELQVGAFELVEQAQTKSIQDIIAALQSQVEAQQNYRTNLQTLNEYIQKDSEHNWSALISIFAEGGIGMAGELQGVVDAIESGDEDALAALAELTVGINEETAASGNALGELAGLSETAIGDAADAIKRTSPKVLTEAKESAKKMQTGFKSGATAAGPVIATDAKTAVVTKAVMGISSSKARLGTEAKAAAQTMGPAFKSGAANAGSTAKAAAGGMVDSASGAIESKKPGLQATASETGKAGGTSMAQGAKDVLPQVKEAGGNLTQGLADGIDAKKAVLEQKAKEAAQAALRQFKNVPEIASPSKVTTGFGEYVSLGYARGIERKIRVIEAAAARAAAAALQTVGGNRMMDIPETGAIDPDRMYAAVREGVQSQERKIYLGSRELTRSLQDMGVVFTHG